MTESSAGPDALWPTPSDWRWLRLGDIADLRIGKTPRRAESAYWDDGYFPWVTIGDLNNGLVTTTKESVSEAALNDGLSLKIAPAGTLLVSFKLTIGKVGILGMDATHNEAIAAVFPDSGTISRDYLFYLFRTFPFAKYRDPYVKGPTLNKAKLLRLPIPVPPLDAQMAVVEVLEAIRANRDAHARLTDALDTTLMSLTYSLMRGIGTAAKVE